MSCNEIQKPTRCPATAREGREFSVISSAGLRVAEVRVRFFPVTRTVDGKGGWGKRGERGRNFAPAISALLSL